jgi:hypothetical protein
MCGKMRKIIKTKILKISEDINIGKIKEEIMFSIVIFSVSLKIYIYIYICKLIYSVF